MICIAVTSLNWNAQIEYHIRRDIGGTLIWRITKNQCLAGFNIGGERLWLCFKHIEFFTDSGRATLLELRPITVDIGHVFTVHHMGNMNTFIPPVAMLLLSTLYAVMH